MKNNIKQKRIGLRYQENIKLNLLEKSCGEISNGIKDRETDGHMAADTRDILRNTCTCVTCWQFLVAFHLRLLLHIDTNHTPTTCQSELIVV